MNLKDVILNEIELVILFFLTLKSKKKKIIHRITFPMESFNNGSLFKILIIRLDTSIE